LANWREFEALEPALAESVRELLYQFGVGLGFLATVRADGGPRVHPVCPVLFDRGLYLSIVPSPKRADLLRDRRFALHSFPAEADEDAAYLSGEVSDVQDPTLRGAVLARYVEERPRLDVAAARLDAQLVFECDIARCLVTRTTGHGDPDPKHSIWP
jgi:hypothetical protein